MFCTIWVHSGPLGCLTKLGAKRAELVQKFVPRSRVGIFRNESIRSTPLDPKLTSGAFVLFGCIRDCLVAFQNSMQNGPNKFKSSCHEVASEFFATKAPDPPHWTPNSHFSAFHTIRAHFGPFGCLTTLSTKRVKIVQNFVPRSHVGIFRNERIRSTPLHHKLTFSCVFFNLGAFVTVWLPYKTRCKTGRASAKVCATNSRWNFLQRTHPIHLIHLIAP